MDSDSWHDLSELVVSVLALPPEERVDFLDEACGSDTALRAEVEAILAAYTQAPAYFKRLDANRFPKFSGFEKADLGKDAADQGSSDFSPDPYLLVGKDVAHYRVVQHLGTGGMGVVYKAEDTRLQRTVALKFLPPMLKEDEQARRRFMREAQASSALDHDNICTVYEVNETPDGHFFMVMGYYDGETLDARLAGGPLSIKLALDLAVQIAEGLAHAHLRGIVHRDIKPANLMVIGNDRVKILDFGLARFAGGERITRIGTMLGTAAYMAPEQARGEAIDHRVDIWSLGAVLYEMIAGERAFPGDYRHAALYAVLNVDPQPVTGLRAGVPLQLARLIEKALSKPADARYATMEELIRDLTAIRQRYVDRSALAHAVLETETPARLDDEPHYAGQENGPVKILVVDDEPEMELLMRQKFRRQLVASTWSFTFAGDGQEALHAIEADPDISLVLTDLNMPKMDGLTLLARLAKSDHVFKTVVISAYGDLKNIRTAMNRGAFDFITKPIDFSDLEVTIEKTWRELQVHRKARRAQQQVASIQQEMEVARRIQEAILPLSFPERADVGVYAFTTTARDVSGTFYDFFERDDGRLGFVMGDAVGKGVSAALFMAMSHTFLKSAGRQYDSPGACLTAMNSMLYPEGFSDQAVTVFYGVLDPVSGVVDFANAGHPAPYVLGADGRVAPLDDTGDAPPIWRQPVADYPTRQLSLRPGDGLFLITKGVTRAKNRQGLAFSAERLATQLRENHAAEPVRLIRSVVRAVMDHAGDTPLAHDLTVLALRYRG
jgi:phosphoserine phosphatase RsbU/P